MVSLKLEFTSTSSVVKMLTSFEWFLGVTIHLSFSVNILLMLNFWFLDHFSTFGSFPISMFPVFIFFFFKFLETSICVDNSKLFIASIPKIELMDCYICYHFVEKGYNGFISYFENIRTWDCFVLMFLKTFLKTFVNISSEGSRNSCYPFFCFIF